LEHENAQLRTELDDAWRVIKRAKVDVVLKPCPFCGSPAEMVHMRNGQVYPRCTGGAGTGYCFASRHPNEMEDGFQFVEDAIRVWNMRPCKPKRKEKK
jgi:hypothetical protein